MSLSSKHYIDPPVTDFKWQTEKVLWSDVTLDNTPRPLIVIDDKIWFDQYAVHKGFVTFWERFLRASHGDLEAGNLPQYTAIIEIYDGSVHIRHPQLQYTDNTDIVHVGAVLAEIELGEDNSIIWDVDDDRWQRIRYTRFKEMVNL